MHKTLKAETARPPRRTLAAQQRRFDWFRQRYNAERPHEALGQQLPASVYHASARPYPTRLLPIAYPGHYEVRRVSRNGGIRWGSRWVNVSHVLAELDVGFEEIDDGLWEVYFGPVWLGRLHETTCRIVDHLRAAGFSNDDISVLLPDKAGTRDFAVEKGTKAPEGALTGASTGGVVGGALGWLAGIGMLAIPGLGPFIAAGPIMAALSGAAVGATAGGVVGALIGMGIPEYEAKRYEGKLREGRILMSVHSETAEQTKCAKEIFERDGAEDIASTGEEGVKEDNRWTGRSRTSTC